MTVMNLQTLVSVLHGQLKVPVSALGPDARRNLITVVVNGAMFTFAPPIKPDTADKNACEYQAIRAEMHAEKVAT